jgi:DNA-binding NtrC family response regulator
MIRTYSETDLDRHVPRTRKGRILVIDDEVELCRSLAVLLSREGFDAECAHSGKEALERLSRGVFDLLICDLVMPDIGGIRLLSRLKQEIPVIMITAHASVATARQAFKLGVRDYITKPVEFDELRVIVRSVLDESGMDHAQSGDLFVADSGNNDFRRLVLEAKRFAATDMPMLISGESGVGKERLSDFVVQNSARSDAPYLKINCAAIPAALLESELFGHERGAFTGAAEKKIGKVEKAHGGTLLLDEVGDMPLDLQAKLLRFLEDFRFERLGSTESLQSDLRVIACTNQVLDSRMSDGLFRKDLFHRLNGVSLHIPALRERTEDIEMLFRFFLSKFNQKYQKSIDSLTPEVLDLIHAYPWPGNIRELRNVVERAVVICDEDTLESKHLPPALTERSDPYVGRSELPATSEHVGGDQTVHRDMERAQEEFMRKMIVDALRLFEGNRSKTAESLGISRKTLYNWIRRLDIRHDFL